MSMLNQRIEQLMLCVPFLLAQTWMAECIYYSSEKCKPNNITFETAVPQDGRIEIAGVHCWTFD